MAYYKTVWNLTVVKILKRGDGRMFFKLAGGKVRPFKAPEKVES